MKYIMLILMLLVSSAMADKILLLREINTYPWKSYLESIGHEVTVSRTTPTNISIVDYDQVWVAYYGPEAGGNGEPLAATRENLKTFLADGGKVALFTDHSSRGSWTTTLKTNKSVEYFVDDVVDIAHRGEFKISNITAGNFVATINIDPIELAKINPQLAIDYGTAKFETNNPGFVHTNNVAGGYGFLYADGKFDCKVAIAYDKTNLDRGYSNGRLIVYLDIGNSLGDQVGGNTPILKIIADVVTGEIDDHPPVVHSDTILCNENGSVTTTPSVTDN